MAIIGSARPGKRENILVGHHLAGVLDQGDLNFRRAAAQPYAVPFADQQLWCGTVGMARSRALLRAVIHPGILS
jgi:hypothetical protein